MKIDQSRIRKYLLEISLNSEELKQLIEKNQIKPGSIELKAVKYTLIELAEAISNVLQHLLAKIKGIPVYGYIDTITKSEKQGIISKALFQKLKPFFDFRNSLIHRYWIMKDDLIIKNVKDGKNDFDLFVNEIETYLKHIPK